MKRLWLKRVLFTAMGIAGGYLYYALIGCTTGACPITSNPVTSMMYGAAVGFLLTVGDRPPKS